MKLLIFSPAAADSTRGNRITAVRWAKMLDQLGHVVTVVDPVEFESVDISDFDGLIALHARHASAAIKTFTVITARTNFSIGICDCRILRPSDELETSHQFPFVGKIRDQPPTGKNP